MKHTSTILSPSGIGKELLILLFFVSVSLNIAAEPINPHHEQEQDSCSSIETQDLEACNTTMDKNAYSQHQCQLYLAKSSIPNAGNGVYSAKSYKQGDTFGGKQMLITFNINDEYYSNRLSDAFWHASLDGRLGYEISDPMNVSIYTPGFGTINCHFGLINVEIVEPSYNSAGLHRSKDPGVGAFTYWHNLTLIATRDIYAGEELFIFYGQEYFDSREDHIGIIPRKKDYNRANQFVQELQSIHEKNPFSNSTKHTAILEEFWSMVRPWITKPEMLKVLPETYGELMDVRTHGTARHSIGGASSMRSQQWLHENGLCVDNMYVDQSLIPQAGRGAFATRFLSKGSIVAPTPVLQVHRDLLFDESTGFELLLNYAFGHPDSPVFLLPYSSNINFINHDSQSPNVELRWSTSKTLHNRRDLLELSYKEVVGSEFGLLMEFVALRDIQPHEEILLHYGETWERTWLEHLDSWKPISGAESYISAEDAMNSMGILTMDEQTLNPYPDNVQTACYFIFSDGTTHDEDKDDGGSIWLTWDESNYECLRWCNILERNEEVSDDGERVSYSYNALMLPQDSNLDEECILSTDKKIYVLEIPSEAVTLVDRSFSRDQYIPNAFRHYIQLSDDLYPELWRVDRSVPDSQ